MSEPTSLLLARVVDEYISWLVDWHRIAFFEKREQQKQIEAPPPPATFDVWHASAIKALQQHQPAVEKLADLRSQLHTLARLVFLKSPAGMIAGQATVRADYGSVLQKYQELMQGLRRLERAFAMAASGLDELTGLRSRHGLQEDLAREHNRFMRGGKPFCIAIMDIDHFKTINDTYGHDAGDRVLASVADHISRSLRIFDDAYRLGGEEFLLCLKEADQIAGVHVLERLRSGLEKTPISLEGGISAPVTASFGFLVSSRDLTIEDMLKRADQALYQAKGSGRNRIEAA